MFEISFLLIEALLA